MNNHDLFLNADTAAPLAARMRPKSLETYVGQEHLLGPGKPLRLSIEQGNIHSMLLWGPPGTGKTTLARLIAHYTDSSFITISAVLSGVKEIREAVAKAQANLSCGRKTILFVDEVHRFNKSQQDAFLPYVEDGTIVFIGATTENPSFEINNALLSRARVYVLKALSDENITAILSHAMAEKASQADSQAPTSPLLISHDVLGDLSAMSNGDARKALNLLEIVYEYAASQDVCTIDDSAFLSRLFSNQVRHFDKKGDRFYEQISALHKAVRGSSPDGALYWFARMIDGGCDPLYIARRVVRMASEDIGNADPRALSIALSAWDVQQRLGSPEGELAIAQAVVYLSSAAKSNAVYNAFNRVMADIKADPDFDVPLHLRNAPTQLMVEQGYGEQYRYAHDEPMAYAAGECYLPEEIAERRYYAPVDRGLESKIRTKLAYFQSLDDEAAHKRYK